MVARVRTETAALAGAQGEDAESGITDEHVGPNEHAGVAIAVQQEGNAKGDELHDGTVVASLSGLFRTTRSLAYKSMASGRLAEVRRGRCLLLYVCAA